MTGRAFLGTSIVVAWAAGMGLMAQRELNRSPAQRLAEAAVGIAPDAEFFAIRRDGAQMGFSSMTVDTVEQGLQFSSYVVTSDGALASRKRVSTQEVTRASRGLGFRSARFRRAWADSVVTRHAELIGESLLVVVTGKDSTRQVVSGPIITTAMLPAAIGLGPTPKIGQTYTYNVYDAENGTLAPWRFTIQGDSIFVLPDSAMRDSTARRWRTAHTDSARSWRVVSDNGRFDAWVTNRGQQAHARVAGASWERTAYELAFENWRAGSSADAAPANDSSTATLPMLPPVESATYVVQGLPLGSLAAASALQAVSGDTVSVARWHTTPASPEFWLPLHWRLRQKYASLLRVEPQINPEEPLIVATAKRLRGRENDPRRVAQYLSQWVSDSIGSSADVASDAASTLRSRAGTNAGRLHLFVALARAADIPTQVVSGVLVDEKERHFHVWAECYYGGWIAVDPVLRHFPADARHVRLTIAGEDVREEVMRLVNRARWQVILTSPSLTH